MLPTCIFVALFKRDRLSLEALDNAIKEADIRGPLLFMHLYAIATVLFLPGSIVTFARSALFGPLAGTIRVSLNVFVSPASETETHNCCLGRSPTMSATSINKWLEKKMECGRISGQLN